MLQVQKGRAVGPRSCACGLISFEDSDDIVGVISECFGLYFHGVDVNVRALASNRCRACGKFNIHAHAVNSGCGLEKGECQGGDWQRVCLSRRRPVRPPAGLGPA